MIRVGILGSGVGIRTHLPAFRRTGLADVAAIYSPNTVKLRELAAKHSIPIVASDPAELFSNDDLDLIVIASPNGTHEEYVRRSVASGKHFLCEKPLGRTADESRAIATLVPKNYPRWTAVNHQLRFNPYLRIIRGALADGSLGRLISLRISQLGTAFANSELQWSWSFDEAAGGGVRLAMGSHLLDLAVFLSGQRPARIDALMDPIRFGRPLGNKMVDVNVSSTFTAFGELESGAALHVSTNASAFSGSAFDIEIFCERGEIRFDLDRKIRIFRLGSRCPDTIVELQHVTPEERTNKVSIFSGSFVYFAGKIIKDIIDGKTHTEDACDFGEAIYVSEMLDAALASYKTGTSIALEKGSAWRGSY